MFEYYYIYIYIYMYIQGLQEKFCKAEQDCFWGPGNSLRLLSKLRIWGSGYNVNVGDDQQPEFRSISEFYIIIFLNKLKIVENIPPPSPKMNKNLIKSSVAKAMGPFKDSRVPQGSPDPGPIYRLNPLS